MTAVILGFHFINVIRTFWLGNSLLSTKSDTEKNVNMYRHEYRMIIMINANHDMSGKVNSKALHFAIKESDFL